MTLIRSMTCKLAAVAMLAAVLLPPAAAGGGRPLPEMAIYDSGGLVVDSAGLRQPGRWMLLVLDAEMASSQSVVTALARRADGYDGRMVVVVSGARAAAQSFIAANQKLPGVRWLTDPDRASGAALQLSATPVLLAIDENNQIGWQLAGQPGRGTLGSMIAHWLRLAPAAK
jgi:hypothetical protein